MTAQTLFLDGKMVRMRKALLDSLTPGILKGKGAFETMRVCGGVICDLQEHIGRLGKGLKALKVRSPWSEKQFKQYLVRTVKANGFERARVRIAVWEEKRVCRIAVVCLPFRGYPKRKYQKGFHAVISTIKRRQTRSAHIKSLDYACFYEAFLEAKRAQCDEAVLLNGRKQIVEGSRTNIFFVNNGVVYTPAVACGCLNGITRRQVIRCARRAKVPVQTVTTGLRALFQAQEAFVTNSLIGVMPLTAVDGRAIGRRRVGPVTQKLARLYGANVHSSCCPRRGKSV